MSQGEEIAKTIESRPVLGHWPHMRAELDANYVRELEALYAEAKSQRDEWQQMYMRMKGKWLDACEKIPASALSEAGVKSE